MTDHVAPVQDPTKTGYAFAGWYNGNTKFDIANDTVTSSMTLKAAWTAESVIVETYYQKETELTWTKMTTTVSGTYDQMIDTKPVEPTVNGKKLSAWYTEEALTNRWYFSGETLPTGKKAEDYAASKISNRTYDSTKKVWTVKLYAKMETVYVVKIYDEDKTTLIQSLTATKGDIVPAAPSKTGKTFNGWTDKSGNAIATTILTYDSDKKQYTFAKEDATALDLYAKYVTTTHKITYQLDANFTGFDATGVTKDPTSVGAKFIDVEYGKKTVAPTYKVTSGYDVSGWYELGGAKFTFGTEIDKDYTLVPEVKVAWTVTFKTQSAKEGDYSNYKTATVFNAEKAEKPADPTAVNGKFLGWYAEGTTAGTPGDTAFDFTAGITKNVNVYAKFNWENIITYPVKVTYTGKTGSDESETQNIVSGEYAVEPTLPTLEDKTFDHWENQADKTTFVFTTPITGPVTLKAVYNEIKHTVTFNTDGGTAIAYKEVAHNAVITGVTNPTKTNYQFKGWYSDAAFTKPWAMETDKVTADMTLYAKFEGNDTVVTYTLASADQTAGAKFKGQTSYAAVAVTVPYGSVASDVKASSENQVPTVVAPDGYKFIGWKTSEKDWDIDQDKVTGAITLIAKFATETFTVKFETNGGTTVANQYVAKGKTVDFSKILLKGETASATKTAPVREGFALEGASTGWYKDAAFGTEFKTTDTITEDTTLYAKWAEAKFVVTFTGVTTAIDPKTVTYGEKVEKPAEPDEVGKVFDGWYTEAAFVNVYNFDAPVTKALTLYAKFSTAYTVTFKTKTSKNDDWTGSFTKKVKATNTEKVDLSGMDLTTAAGPFVAWYDKKPTDTTAKVVDLSTTAITGPVTYYAKYDETKETVKVTFYYYANAAYSNAKDADGGTTQKEVYVVKGETVTAPTLTLDGATFVDWKKGTSSGFTSSAPFSFSTPIDAELTLAADWQTKYYTITFNSNGGSSVPSVTNAEYGKSVTLPTAPTKSGYHFVGWFTDEALTVAFKASDGVKKDTTLFAKWTGDEYSVTLVPGTGNTVSGKAKLGSGATADITSNVFKVPYQVAIAEVPAAVSSNSNQAFEGWYYDADLTKPLDTTKPITEAISLYAKYMNDVDLSLKVTSWVYDGKAHADNVKAVATPKYATDAVPAVTIEYKKSGADDSTYSATAPKDAGNYIVRASIAKGTTTIAKSETAELLVSQKEVTLKWSTETKLTYTGAEQAPAVTVEGAIEGDDTSLVITGKGIKVGKYTATASIPDSSNYKLAATATKTCDFTIEASSTEPTVEATVNEDGTVTVTMKAADGSVISSQKVEIGKDASSDDFDIKTTQNPDGTVTVTMTPKAGGGYQLSSPITVTGTIAASALPAATKISALKPGKKKMTVSWTAVDGVEGYELQYGLKKGAAGKMTPVAVAGAATAKTTIKKLTKGKRYYFRIRTYKTVNGQKLYSDWSAWKRASKKQKIK